MDELKELLLRRRHCIIADGFADCIEEQPEKTRRLITAALKNIQSLGFGFSHPALKYLCSLSYDDFVNFYQDTLPVSKELTGADVKYKPMYPNFPRQVAKADDAELFFNAVIHYLTYGTLTPDYTPCERIPLIDEGEFTEISIGNYDDLIDIFVNLVSAKTSLSSMDKEDIATIIKNCPYYGDALPEVIPLKETVALIGKIIFEEAAHKRVDCLEKYYKTATDVLRLITALSNGDISLAENVKFRKMNRSERRMIMDLLSNCGNLVEDMFRYKNRWIRIGEILHPSEFKNPKYKDVLTAFNSIRNEHKPLMFGGKVQGALLSGNVKLASDLLKGRPGEMARKLDKLIRDSENPNYVINNFKDIAEQISVPVLLQVRQHFIFRKDSDADFRVFFLKGATAKVKSIPNMLPPISVDTSDAIISICEDAIIQQLREKEYLGKIFVSDELSNYLVPFSQRSASKAVKTIVRGSKVAINNNSEAVRAFIWWTNTNGGEKSIWDDGRVDIDLSAAIFDEDWRYIEHVSYTHLRSPKYKAYHSGDITNGGSVNGDGVAEFLDVDVNAVAKNSGRYIVFQVYNYTEQKYSCLPNCRFGWMEREDVNSGEIFEPKTVKQKIDLTSDSTVAIPVIFDCKERCFIWCDMAHRLDDMCRCANNLENNLQGVRAVCYSMTHMSKPNLFDLILMNAAARGCLVDDRNEADIIFDTDETKPVEKIVTGRGEDGEEIFEIKEKDVTVVTPFDVDYIAAQLM